ncbi:MAG: hypothetical protein U1C66_02920 [Patescibacteria group bacterium]|nr:hypothetical protein [Patescibacteria group bacterium]
MKPAVFAALVLAALGGWWYFELRPAPAEEPVACTADAMQCPDGSYVGRTGPNCEFVCPGGGGSGTGGGGILPYNSGVRGTVMMGPTCPVEQYPPQAECADRPYQTLVAVFRASDPTHAFVLTESDVQGMFEVSLPPGDYLVGAGESALPSCTAQEVTVEPDLYTSITVSCDSGIR